ncbi:hypothetical protein ACFV6B_04390 [Streptomyces microflavus]|uniref:hypothetical protein n=1 Tax=Streptomyces microflavus TaxID=1919 RepID=UPI00365AEA7B
MRAVDVLQEALLFDFAGNTLVDSEESRLADQKLYQRYLRCRPDSPRAVEAMGPPQTSARSGSNPQRAD